MVPHISSAYLFRHVTHGILEIPGFTVQLGSIDCVEHCVVVSFISKHRRMLSQRHSKEHFIYLNIIRDQT